VHAGILAHFRELGWPCASTRRGQRPGAHRAGRPLRFKPPGASRALREVGVTALMRRPSMARPRRGRGGRRLSDSRRREVTPQAIRPEEGIREDHHRTRSSPTRDLARPPARRPPGAQPILFVQPAVSQTVCRLEGGASQPLFARRVRLTTPAGRGQATGIAFLGRASGASIGVCGPWPRGAACMRSLRALSTSPR